MPDDEQFLEYYDEHRERLIERRHTYSKLLDRTLVTLSGSAFGLSLTATNLFAENGEIACFPLLVATWVAFGLSLVLVIISFLLAKETYDEELEMWHDYLGSRDYVESSFRSWITRVNAASVIMFGIGCILMPVFIGINMTL